MLTMTLIFQKDLGTLIPPSALVFPPHTGRPALVLRHLTQPSSLKDLIESLGVPHCEIGTVFSLISGLELPLDARTVASDVLAVAGADPRSLASPRFLCDGHLGKLALLLRVMGFDTAWDDSWSEPGMARRGINEKRTVLTRSRSLLKRASMDNAMLIRSGVADLQAAEVLRRFLLVSQVRLFGRCSKCNGRLREVAKADVAARIPPRTAKWLDTYYLCRECDHLFWEGTHVTALRQRVARILSQCAATDHSDEP